jgi:gluconolactonase
VKSDGSIYFTDPPYGRVYDHVGKLRTQELDFQGVYRLEPGSQTPTLLIADFDRPNGLCFSIDERHFLVTDSAHNHIRIFDVQDCGLLTNGRLWGQLEGSGAGPADGIKIDSHGNVYCTGPGGIHVLDPDANYLGIIHLPEQTANLCFGDDDMRSLYITASTSLFRLRVHLPGQPLGPSR